MLDSNSPNPMPYCDTIFYVCSTLVHVIIIVLLYGCQYYCVLLSLFSPVKNNEKFNSITLKCSHKPN